MNIFQAVECSMRVGADGRCERDDKGGCGILWA